MYAPHKPTGRFSFSVRSSSNELTESGLAFCPFVDDMANTLEFILEIILKNEILKIGYKILEV